MNYTSMLDGCMLCPRHCGARRFGGERGFCGEGDKIRIARCALHYWEEPCISGENGSGAVFFSGCTMRCDYCQNREISRGGKGYELTPPELAEKFLYLSESKAENINLVTPTHFVPLIIEALDIARRDGLSLPVVYNCGGYESVDTIRLLDGYVDVYLPDFKYFSDKYAVRYSAAKDYFRTASEAIAEMYKQVGKCRFDENGIIKSGVIVRHLLLPGMLFEAKKIVDYLYETYRNNIWLSLMSQYTVMDGLQCTELNRSVPSFQYDALVDYCVSLGYENVYIQEQASASPDYIPEFYGD